MSLSPKDLAVIAGNRRRLRAKQGVEEFRARLAREAAERVENAERARALREANLAISPRERLVKAGLLLPRATAALLVLATASMCARPACAQVALASASASTAASPPASRGPVPTTSAWETHATIEIIADPTDDTWYVVLWEPGQPAQVTELSEHGQTVFARLAAVLRRPGTRRPPNLSQPPPAWQ